MIAIPDLLAIDPGPVKSGYVFFVDGGIYVTDTEENKHIIAADAEICAEHLVRYLAHHGFVDRHFAVADAPVDRSGNRQALAVSANVDQILPDSYNVRSPRPIQGPTRGLQRRSRPYRPAAGRLGKLLRGPRLLGHAHSPRIRGPFPVARKKD